MNHFTNLAELHRVNGFPKLPEHPMISVIRCQNNCSLSDQPYTSDFYMVGFKKMKSGVIKYGRTKYDGDSGSMYFMKPRQVIEMRDIQLEEDGFAIFFHEDFLNGHALHSDIKKYNFFEYETNEALHLSPKEEEIMWELYNKIESEYNNNADEYSRIIILSHVDSILKYSQRFYKRQFIHRTELSGKVISKFNTTLTSYFESGQLQDKGLPTVKFMADELHLSPRYLSDTLKQETGKTAIELIHISLMSEAKHLLQGPDNSIGEIAYSLGFENLPYFSRLFKKEVGLSPVQYKKQWLN
jgi:AraC family transcriptional regulator, transcriptional activator of pobA